jgi:hypothetical protein
MKTGLLIKEKNSTIIAVRLERSFGMKLKSLTGMQLLKTGS